MGRPRRLREGRGANNAVRHTEWTDPALVRILRSQFLGRYSVCQARTLPCSHSCRADSAQYPAGSATLRQFSYLSYAFEVLVRHANKPPFGTSLT